MSRCAGDGRSNPASWFCAPGSSAPKAVTAGYYSTPEGALEDVRSGEKPCATSETCVNGKRANGVLFHASWPAAQGNACPSGAELKNEPPGGRECPTCPSGKVTIEVSEDTAVGAGVGLEVHARAKVDSGSGNFLTIAAT